MAHSYQTISMALRAPKVAIIFDGEGDWHAWASQAIHAAGRCWGGAGFVLIPHHNGSVEAPMLDLAAAYDPDYVVTFMRSIADIEAVSPGTVQFKAEDGQELTDEAKAEALAFSGDHLISEHAGMRARDAVAEVCNPYRMFIDSHGYDERMHTLVRAHISSPLTDVTKLGGEPIAVGVSTQLNAEPSWTLALAMRTGFAEAPAVPFSTSERVTDDLAREQIDFALQPSRRGVPDLLRVGPGTSSAWDRSTVGLVRVSPTTVRRVPFLVATGESPEDFCLAYAWDRMYGSAAWLPLGEMPADGSPERVPVWSLGMEVRGQAEHEQRSVWFTSASLSAAQVAALRDGLVGSGSYSVVQRHGDENDEDPGRADRLNRLAVSVEPRELDWPLGGGYAIAESYDHSFTLPAEVESDGTVRLLTDIPLVEPTAAVLSDLRDWETDVRFNERTCIFGRQLDPAVLLDPAGRPGRETWIRSGRECFSLPSFSYGLVLAGSTRRQSMARARLVLPGLRNWVDGMLLHADTRSAYSDAGRRVEVLRRAWGGHAELVADWAGPRRAIFNAFTPTARRTTDAYPHGEGENLHGAGYLTFDGMASIGGADSADVKIELRDWVDGLLERQILRRGLILQCDDCDWRDFLPLSSLGDVNACTRCGAGNMLRHRQWSRKRREMEPAWYYDLHQAARQILTHDGGVALLAADYLRRRSKQFDVVAELDFIKTLSNDQLAEIDLIAVSDGRVIVAEAKKTPGLGGKRERAKKVQALCVVARLLHADEVLLCSAGQGPWPPTDVDSLRAAVHENFAGRHRQPTVAVLTGLDEVATEYSTAN